MGCRVSTDRNRVYIMEDAVLEQRQAQEYDWLEIERIFEDLNHTGQGVHIENFRELHLRCTGEDYNFVQVERALKVLSRDNAAPPKYMSLDGYRRWLETRNDCRKVRVADSEALRNGDKEEGVFSNIENLRD